MTELLVRHTPLLNALPRSELEYLIATLPQHTVQPHTILFREGDYGDRCYLVLAGELEIIQALESPDEHLLSVMEPGDLIGEISLLNPDRLRTASARTRSEVRLLELTRPDFEALLQRQPALAFEMVRTMSQRLRNSHDASMRELGHQLSQAYQDLQAAQAKLIEQEKLARDLELARELQQRMLPRTLPILEGFEFGAHMIPARVVGGDFFDFIPLGDDRVGFVVADVCGKGVAAGLHMALTRGLLRAELGRPVSPREALLQVNRHLLEMSDAGIFVTVLYGVLERSTRAFTYVRAGHAVPIVMDDRGELIELAPGVGQPLGILPDPALDAQTLVLPPSATLVLYTDGVTEALDPEYRFFGEARLYDAIRASIPASAQELCDRLLHQVIAYQGSAPQHDDITLLAVRARE